MEVVNDSPTKWAVDYSCSASKTSGHNQKSSTASAQLTSGIRALGTVCYELSSDILVETPPTMQKKGAGKLFCSLEQISVVYVSSCVLSKGTDRPRWGSMGRAGFAASQVKEISTGRIQQLLISTSKYEHFS